MSYRETFTWQLQSATRDSTGDRPESFADNGVLWGNLESVTGSTGIDFGAFLSNSTAIATLAQWPTVAAKDRLIHRRFNETYEITGVVRKSSPNEVVCQLVKYVPQIGDQ